MLDLSHGQKGFTLMELIMVIVIAGILGTMTVSFITKPMEGYIDLTRRAELVDSADMAMRQMARDIRAALPNSIHIPDVTRLEMIHVRGGGRYDELDFSSEDTDFIVHGGSMPSGSGGRLVIYNLGVAGADARSGDAVITPASTDVAISGSGMQQSVALNPGHQFAFESPLQRVYLVDQHIGYCCAGNALYRHNYAIGTAMPACTSGSLVTRHMQSCAFSYDPGTQTRSALATLQLVLEQAGERISLLHQVHVGNLP
ncbi:MAG: type II secretion system GspH family protein [Chromatiales bacterium]|nr:type II secretion system protein [Gammaproteobacteria bacterium]MBW6475924.1 type II secretion system GspH family protein [Chromatiales bacterium]